MGKILQQNCLTRARRRHNQAPLAFTQRRHDIDHARRKIFPGRVRNFHLKALIGIKRRQIVKMNFVPGFLGSSKFMVFTFTRAK